LNHKKLFDAWAALYDNTQLSKEQYHVFRAITQYAYIEKDDLKKLYRNQREAEKALRKNIEQGVDAYFESPRKMREAIRLGQLPIYKNKSKGIPHGLAVSATLANVYMWEFDRAVSELIYKNDGQYRRYSDDIIVLIPKNDALKSEVTTLIQEKLEDDLALKLSPGKTEEYTILHDENGDVRVAGKVKAKKKHACTGKCRKEGVSPQDIDCKPEDYVEKTRESLHYLGLELFGKKGGEKQVFIKLTTLAKFQNKMKQTVRRYVRRAYLRAERGCMPVPELFYNELRRRFTFKGIKKGKFLKKIKELEWHPFREVYDFKIKEEYITPRYGGSLSYVRKFDRYVYGTPPEEMGKGQKQFKRMKSLLFKEIKKERKKYE
jgi:hypothetical protein